MTGRNAQAAREVGKALSHELEGSAVLGSALDALGYRSGAEAENVKLMKSGEEDGRLGGIILGPEHVFEGGAKQYNAIILILRCIRSDYIPLPGQCLMLFQF